LTFTQNNFNNELHDQFRHDLKCQIAKGANMAEEVSILDRDIADRLELEKELALLSRWGYLTGAQYATLLREVSFHLPCLVMLDMRAKKGKVKVILVKPGSVFRFSVDNRAKVILPPPA
jgi:hypothetical protein